MVMAENVSIREAGDDDIATMSELLHALFSIEADFVADGRKQQEGLRRLLSRGEQACVLVAETDRQIVGMCTLQTLISTAEGGPVGLIEDMVVAEPWRGKGIGRRLLLAMEQWAQEHGLSRIQLLADRDNAPALAFYEAMAWTPTRLVALRKRP